MCITTQVAAWLAGCLSAAATTQAVAGGKQTEELQNARNRLLGYTVQCYSKADTSGLKEDISQGASGLAWRPWRWQAEVIGGFGPLALAVGLPEAILPAARCSL